MNFNVSKLAPFAKAVVAVCGSVLIIVAAVAGIAGLFVDGVLSESELPVLLSNVTVIAAALGLPVAVYKVPNRSN
jgi:hypothetical protein